MDLNETWQMGLRPEKTKPCTFPAKSREIALWVSERARKMGRRGVFFVTWTTHHFCHFPSIDFRKQNFPLTRVQVVARDAWFYIPENWEKFPLTDRICCTLFVLSLRSQEMFCDAYTLSIPYWTSHRFNFPRCLLLRDVPFSTYPPAKVSLSAMAIPGWGQSRHLARGGTNSIGL